MQTHEWYCNKISLKKKSTSQFSGQKGKSTFIFLGLTDLGWWMMVDNLMVCTFIWWVVLIGTWATIRIMSSMGSCWQHTDKQHVCGQICALVTHTYCDFPSTLKSQYMQVTHAQMFISWLLRPYIGKTWTHLILAPCQKKKKNGWKVHTLKQNVCYLDRSEHSTPKIHVLTEYQPGWHVACRENYIYWK